MNPKIRSALILADIEGIAGVCEKRQCTPYTPEWQKARNLITEDVNAAVLGLLDAGVQKIHVRDMHATGFNILSRRLHPKARLRQGHHWSPIPLLGSLPRADLALMIGWHAAPDQKNAFSPHIFHKAIQEVRINGAAITEVEIFAAILGEAGIPVGMLTADATACERIRKNLPWITDLPIPKSPLCLEEITALRSGIRKTAFRVAKDPVAFSCYREPSMELFTDIMGEKQTRVVTSGKEILSILLQETAFKGFPPFLLSPFAHGFRLLHAVKERAWRPVF